MCVSGSKGRGVTQYRPSVVAKKCEKVRWKSGGRERREGGGGSNAALCGIEMKMSSVARLFLPDA